MAVVNQLSIGGSLYDINDKRNLYDLLYPVGSVYISSTNTNPSTQFGGTWELIDKYFKYKKVSYSSFGSYITMNTTNVTSISSWGDITWFPSSISLRFGFVNKVNYAVAPSAAYPVFTFNVGDLGLSGIDNLRFDAQTDNKGPTVHMAVNGNDNQIEVKGCTAQPGASQTICVVYNIPIKYTNKLDSWCDRFFWKRTA